MSKEKSGTETVTMSAYDQGLQLYRAGQYDAAIPLLTEALKQNPELEAGWEALGFCQFGLHQDAEADESFRRAVALGPGQVNAHYGLGITLIRERRFEEAVKELEEAHRIDPSHPYARQALVQALEGLADKSFLLFQYEEGKRHLIRAIELSPLSSTPVALLADKLIEHQHKDEAIALVRAAYQRGAKGNDLDQMAYRLHLHDLIPTQGTATPQMPVPTSAQTPGPRPAPVPVAPAPRPAVATATAVTATPQHSEPKEPAARTNYPRTDAIQCPKCQQWLALTASVCQFCGTDVSRVPRPVVPVKQRVRGATSRHNMKLVWRLYYFFSALWMFDGLRVVIAFLVPTLDEFASGNPFASWGIAGMLIGIINMLIGLGLILKVERIRGAANFLCGMNLLSSLVGLGMAILVSGALGIWGLVSVFISMLYVVLYGAQIWVIGETD